MRIVVFLFVYLIICTIVTGQEDYQKYHRLINEAERLLTIERFADATALYAQVIDEYDYVFVKDYLIGAQVAHLAKDDLSAAKWITRAVLQGYTCECVERIRSLSTFVSTPHFDEIRLQQDSLLQHYYSTIDGKASYDFHRRYIREQSLKTPGKRAQYEAIVKDNFEQIKDYMVEHPFPSERLLGIDNSQYHKNKQVSRGLNSCGASNSKIIPTLLHYDNPITKLGYQRLVDAIWSGHLHPRQFAIYSFETNGVSRLTKNQDLTDVDLPSFCFQMPFGRKCNSEKQVAADRARFGIGSVALDRAKEVIKRKYLLRLDFGYK